MRVANTRKASVKQTVNGISPYAVYIYDDDKEKFSLLTTLHAFTSSEAIAKVRQEFYIKDEKKYKLKAVKLPLTQKFRPIPKEINPATRKAANAKVLRTYVTPEKMRMSDLLGSLKHDYRTGEVIEVWYKDIRYTWQKSGANSWKKLSGTPKRRNARNGSSGAISGDSDVRSPTRTSTSTEAHTSDNITVTGGAGAGATTSVTIRRNAKNPRTRRIFQVDLSDGSRLAILALSQKAAAKKAQNPSVYFSIKKSVTNFLNGKAPIRSGNDKTDALYLLEHEKPLLTIAQYNRLKEYIKNYHSRRNPETFNANKLDELSAMFQGEINGKQIKSVGSDFVPNVTARIGQLSLMKIRNGNDLYELKFKRNGDAWLGMDSRKNLHIIGKDSVVKNAVKPKHGQLTLLGELEQVNYITAKNHIENGRLTEYYHKLGEVDGIKPNVFIDHDGFMIINGGGYDIGVNGIEN